MSRSVMFRLANPFVATANKLVMVVGLAYPFQPIDLIPDRLPWIGHIDNVGLPALGIISASLLMREVIGANVIAAWLHRIAGGLALPVTKRAAEGPGGRFLLRLLLGRAPDNHELAAFTGGLWSSSHALPPLLRGIACVPSAAPLLSRAILMNGAGRSFDDWQMRGNLAAIWTGPKIRFLHIEKTAGSSLVAALAAQFHPVQIHCDSDSRRSTEEGTVDQTQLSEAHRRAALVWGHHDLPSQLALDRGETCYRLCLLRDPQKRLLSLYYFWRGSPDMEGKHISFAQETGLLDFLRATDVDIRNDIDNLYVRRLTGLYVGEHEDPLVHAPALALAQASKALARLDFVGLTEELGQSLAILGRALGFTPPEHTPQMNVQSILERNALRPRRASVREPITAEIQEEIDRLTRLDKILYEQAKERFAHLSRGCATGPTLRSGSGSTG